MYEPTSLAHAIEVIKVQSEEIQALKKLILTQQQRLEKLEGQVKKNSRNSSKPPSSDQKGNSGDGRCRGGAKKGHKGHFRAAIPANQVTERIQVTPEKCSRCGSADLVSERKPKFHREIDLPEICRIVREYRLEQCRCQHCGKHVKAELPEGVTGTIMGARLTSVIAAWSYQLTLPIRKLRELVAQLTGYRFSSATILACQQRVSEALKNSHDMIAVASRSEPWLGADETPWPTHGQKRYCWLASGNSTTFIKLLPRRNRACSQELLGKTEQPLVTDRYSAYAPQGPHQYCLAHWKRDIEGLPATALDLQESVGIDLDAVFDLWRRYQIGELNRSQWYRLTAYRREEIEASLLFWSRASSDKRVRRRCDSWLKHYHRFWTFLPVSIEPTNNRTERELRPLVIRRKICGGTRSDLGERFVERLYSVGTTLQKRGADLLVYLYHALHAHWSGQTSPPLP